MFGGKKQKERRILKECPEGNDRIVRSGKKSSLLKKKNRPFSRFLVWFLFFVFWGTAIYLIFFSGFLKIIEINIQTGEIVNKEEISKIINSKLEGKYFNFLEKNNFLLLSGKNLKKEIFSKFRIINRIETKKKFPNAFSLAIFERKPLLFWVSGEKKWMVDEDGIIFDEANEDFSYLGRSDFPIVFDGSNKLFSLGKVAMEKDYTQFISDFRRKSADEAGVEFEREIRIPSVSSGEVRMKTKEGWWIFLDESLGAEKEKEMLQAVLENKIEKERMGELEYIDLRIQNKVFYKFRNSQSEVSEEGDKKKEASEEKLPVNKDKKD